MNDLDHYKSSTANKLTEMLVASVVLSMVFGLAAGAFYVFVGGVV